MSACGQRWPWERTKTSPRTGNKYRLHFPNQSSCSSSPPMTARASRNVIVSSEAAPVHFSSLSHPSSVCPVNDLPLMRRTLSGAIIVVICHRNITIITIIIMEPHSWSLRGRKISKMGVYPGEVIEPLGPTSWNRIWVTRGLHWITYVDGGTEQRYWSANFDCANYSQEVKELENGK